MQIDQNDFFRQATIRLCSSLNIKTALHSCYDYIKQYIPMRSMGLYQFYPDEGLFKAVVAVTEEGGPQIEGVYLLPEAFREDVIQHWETMPPIEIVNRPAEDSYFRRVMEPEDFNTSKISMRLQLEGTRVGGVCAKFPEIDQYTDTHKELLQMLHEPLSIAMSNALKHQEVLKLKDMLADDNRFLHNQLREISGTEIVGADFGLKGVLEQVRQVAQMDSPVLVLGETGTGKDLIANALHSLSSRKDGPFIRVNCGAIPDSIIDSELFGHEKGAFTGAISQKRGRFERADGGTIFLDEVGELPPQAQVRLLHVIQNGEIERVGGTKPISVNIRIISATHRKLQDMVSDGQFREDLWFRLNVFPITMPPLRLRKEDIPALVHHFIERKRISLKIKVNPTLAPNAINSLIDYNWPGNVRELENVVERALIRCRDGKINFINQISNTSKIESSVEINPPEVTLLDDIVTRHISQIMKASNGKINGPGGAGELLGVNPNTLRKRMNKLGIPYGRNYQ
ncbi:MAG: AAA domain-containing protein [Desulfobacterales bacterium]|nr:AAA domain-containing protein [Desulfobacterales bacterium]MCP4163649.1 AAA domain-containing protein [Deltaproteobacteria bacterium]